MYQSGVRGLYSAELLNASMLEVREDSLDEAIKISANYKYVSFEFTD